jgi:PAS domain S-box-containing protein
VESRVEDRPAILLTALGVPVYTTDASGVITFFNEAAATFWGRRPDPDDRWTGAWRLYASDGQELLPEQSSLANAIAEDRPISGEEAELERTDGTRGVFLSYAAPLHDASGSLTGAVNVLVDITETRKAEEALWSAAEALAASNVVKDEFLGLVSHELRTPVTTIFGNAQLLRDRKGLPEADRHDMLADIAEESNRLLAIIENLLLLTRLESGFSPDREPQLIAHIARSVVENFVRHHPLYTVSLSMDAGQMVVEADQAHLQMLLDNLLTNAAKYSGYESPIEVQVAREGNEVLVMVRDRGIGIGDADESQLFSAFYRSESAKQRNSGLGIGLTVCHRIVDSLGGRIWAHPREGGGTEAGFALPLAEVLPD